MAEEAKTQEAPPPAVRQQREIEVSQNTGVKLRSLDDLWRFALAIAKSGLAPKSLQSPESIMVAIEMGMEVGLPPMASMQNIAVINGRPSIWGDAMKGVCEASGLVADYCEKEVGTPYNDDYGFSCYALRKGREHGSTNTFTVADAKLAQLWGKAGPWTQYPKRMLKYRARSFTLRDEFPDVLKGMYSSEEVQDMPPKDIHYEEDATDRGKALLEKIEPKPENHTTGQSEPEQSVKEPENEEPPPDGPGDSENADLQFIQDEMDGRGQDWMQLKDWLRGVGMPENWTWRRSLSASTPDELATIRKMLSFE